MSRFLLTNSSLNDTIEKLIGSEASPMKKKRQWIWQHPDYPTFRYDLHLFLPLITQIAQNTGQVQALIALLDQGVQNSIKIDLFTSDIVATSVIEGEHLSRESVRSSIRKKLDADQEADADTSTYYTDTLADLLMDACSNATPLSRERLHQWHVALLSHAPSVFKNIRLGKFREYDDMQIVSGSIGKEKIHYVGLPHKQIDADINALLSYINHAKDPVYIKSAIAHLWFVSIHPYDDGNGRIARLISDYVVSQNFGIEYKYFSISAAIAKDRKSYYDKLETTQNLQDNPHLECNSWITWYLERCNDALLQTLGEIHKIINKTKFWDKIRHIPLNQRQLKVLNKLLQYNAGEFQGGLTSKKYVAMTKTSLATAKRDMQELVQHGCLRRIEGTKGRNVSYEIAYESLH